MASRGGLLAALLRRPRLLKVAFWTYAAALFTGTHWPKLESPGPEGTDKVIHVTVLAGWMTLASLQGWFGPALSERNLLRTLLAAAAYAAVDEGLQAIPFVHRTAALDDYAANLIGIMLAAGALLMLRGRLETREGPPDDSR